MLTYAEAKAELGISTNDPFSGTYRGPAPASEPETQSVIQAIDKYKPKFVLDYLACP